MQDWSWLDEGACRDLDPELFFTTGRDRQDYNRETSIEGRKLARAACARCFVRERCFWEALLRPDPYAMRAGLTPGQLDKLRKTHKRAVEAARRALLSRAA